MTSLLQRRRVLAAAGALLAPAPLLAAEPVVVARLLDGSTFDSDALRGKVILVNFWATWCGPCRVEMPEIDAYYKAHRSRGFEVLALSTDEPADEAKVRDAAAPFTFPVAMMKTARLTGFRRIWRMPVSAVIDRDGKLVRQDWFVEPRLDTAALDEVIVPLL